jgi:hypothetical protein
LIGSLLHVLAEKEVPLPQMGKKKTEKGTEKSAFDKLSDRHKLFVKNYIKNFGNQTRAYMDTYPNASYNAAKSKATLLVTKDNIKQAIKEEYKEIYKEIQTETEKSKTYNLIKTLGDINIADIIDIENGTLEVKNLEDIPMESQHAIASIESITKQTKHGSEKMLKVKMHPKLQALKMRAEIQKLIDPKSENTQLEIVVKPAQRPDRKPGCKCGGKCKEKEIIIPEKTEGNDE